MISLMKKVTQITNTPYNENYPVLTKDNVFVFILQTIMVYIIFLDIEWVVKFSLLLPML